MPHAFLDDVTLVYADAKAGLVLVDLQHDAKVVARIALPAQRPVNHLAALAGPRLVLAAMGQDLIVADARAQRISATLPFGERIASIDVDPGNRRAAVAVGSAIALVDLDHPAAAAPIEVPDAQDGIKVGQVRFARAGASLLVTYGIKVLEFDVAGKSFTGTVGELSGTGMGVDQPTLASVLAKGMVPFVRLFPELGTARRAFTFAPLELQAIDTTEHRARTLRSENPDYEFRGMTAIDQERRGQATAVAAIQSRSLEDQQYFQLRYVSGADGLLVSADGRLSAPFAAFSVPAGDLANQKPDNCQLSIHASFIACQYWSKDTQGLLVWRLLGGNHQFERVAERYNASSGILAGEGDLVLTADKGLLGAVKGAETRLADLGEDWRVVAADGKYLVALSAVARQAMVFRKDKLGVEPVIQPTPATGVLVVPGRGRVLLREADRLRMIDLGDGRSVWAAPLGDLRGIGVAGDRVLAVTATAAYQLEVESGRILKSHPLALAAKAPVAVDPTAGKIAFLNAGTKAMVLDVASGVSETITDAPAAATQFAWSNDVLLVGGADGSVLAWRAGRGQRWLVPTPFAGAFQATAWPDQPPQGVVLRFAVSHDGSRFAVFRQDMPSVDIHRMSDGRLLTQLTPPWSTLKVPAEVSFGPSDELVTAWAVHAMAREKPRFVTVHRLPRNFDEALDAARARLTTLSTVWSPEGPR
jgi:hypothetical protein